MTDTKRYVGESSFRNDARKVKVRLWDSKNKVMIYYAKESKGIRVGPGKQDGEIIFGYDASQGVNLNRPLEASWSTGFRDKNKKEIYEDDVVNYLMDNKCESCYSSTPVRVVGKITFSEMDAGYKVTTYPHIVYSGLDQTVSEKNVEIMGNIHENPKLLDRYEKKPQKKYDK